MATTVVAKLVKRKTDDGFVEVREGVPLGRTYLVEPQVFNLRMQHVPTGTVHTKDVVFTPDGDWLAVELLEIDGASK